MWHLQAVHGICCMTSGMSETSETPPPILYAALVPQVLLQWAANWTELGAASFKLLQQPAGIHICCQAAARVRAVYTKATEAAYFPTRRVTLCLTPAVCDLIKLNRGVMPMILKPKQVRVPFQLLKVVAVPPTGWQWMSPTCSVHLSQRPLSFLPHKWLHLQKTATASIMPMSGTRSLPCHEQVTSHVLKLHAHCSIRYCKVGCM